MKKILCTLAVMSSVFSACGTNQDPLTGLGDSTAAPSLSLPVAQTGMPAAATGTSNPYSASKAAQNGWDIALLQTPGTNIQVLAPVTGFVSSIDLAGSVYGVTFLISPKYSVRVGNIATIPTVQVGQYIGVGSVIATVASGTTAAPLHFTVTQNNLGTVCPASFMSAAALNTFTTVSLSVAQAQLGVCVP